MELVTYDLIGQIEFKLHKDEVCSEFVLAIQWNKIIERSKSSHSANATLSEQTKSTYSNG
jgi:hypothetical protein